MGVSAMTLYSTPGLSQFNNPGGNQTRGNFTISGRSFKVVDATLYEELANGNTNALGNVGNDGSQVSFVACPQQLAIVSAGNLYAYQLATQVFPAIVAGTFTGPIIGPWKPQSVTQISYIDGFFFLLVASSQTIYASNAFDATTWPVDYNVGAFPFPLAAMPSGFIEQGCGAQFSMVELDNAIFLIGQRNDQGPAMAFRTNGFTFQRISTHAVETAWQSYAKISDARAFTYQENGHSFWVITFPSAQATWSYDTSTGFWHKRGFWNAALGAYQAALPICHTYNFGKHLVGDRQSGRTYQMSSPVQAGGGWNFVTDNGALIHRLRRAPHINSEHQWMRYSELEIYLETGLGPEPPLLDGAGNARGPQLFLRISRDGGHTYGMQRAKDCGLAGKYQQRVSFKQLGRARDFVPVITCSDPVPWRFIDAYINPKTQPSPRKRLTHQYAEVA